MSDDDELDMTEGEFDAAFAAGTPVRVVVPVGWRCRHMTLSTGGARPARPPVFGCCKPEPVFAVGEEPS